MYNLSERIVGRAREDEKKKIILRLLKEEASLHMMAVATDWSQEKVTEFLRSKNLQPAQ
jgi:hypothetical protein